MDAATRMLVAPAENGVPWDCDPQAQQELIEIDVSSYR
jgi:hypothetical protein